MFKKYKYILLSFFLIIPALVPIFNVFTADETRVCGVDNRNYPNADWAKKLGIEVSYDFPCLFPSKEAGLFERKENFEFTGMLLDAFVNSNGAQLFLRDNFDKKEYLVLASTTSFKYLPGDQIKIKGQINKNTEIVKLYEYNNLSAQNLNTYDCVLLQKKEIENNLYCQNEGTIFIFNYDKSSRFLAGFVNPASIDNIQIGDYLRVRADSNTKIKTLVVKERVGLKFLKNHIFKSRAKLISINKQKKYLKLDLGSYPNSILDINNDKNSLINLKIKNNTRIVKKYFGKLSLDNFTIGNDLYIIAKANDDGSFEAITIKNNSIWR